MGKYANENIVLIGYMGCGKSTVGRKTARAFGFEFLDTDAFIEEKEGMSVSKLFEEKGEPYFREQETKTIEELLKQPKRKVIATGGGLPVKEENRPLLKQLGKVIYLKCDTETLFKRLSGDTSRPLLQEGELRAKIETMLAARGPVYEETADLILQTDQMTFYEIICQLEKLVKGKI